MRRVWKQRITFLPELTVFSRPWLNVSQPAVSQHIAVLRKAGLLTERKMGRSTLYRVDTRALAPLVDWIARQDRFWRSAMRRLDDKLKEINE